MVIEIIDPIERRYKEERGKPIPDVRHSIVQSNILFALAKKYGDDYDILPELDIILPNGKVVPDMAIYPQTPSDWEHDRPFLIEPPIFTIDISTRNQPLDDMIDKVKHIYFPAGVLSSWIVLTALKMIVLLTPDGKIQTFQEGILKDVASGFEIDTTDIFN